MIIWYIICFVVGGLFAYWRYRREQERMWAAQLQIIKAQQLVMVLSDPIRAMVYAKLKDEYGEEKATEMIIEGWKNENNFHREEP